MMVQIFRFIFVVVVKLFFCNSQYNSRKPNAYTAVPAGQFRTNVDEII